MSEPISPSDETSAAPPSRRTPTGRWVVLGMLGFGLVMVGALWLYWEMYTRPFRPLQAAIAAKYPGSSPRAIGGRHKSHKDETPPTLRIVVRVPEDEFNLEQDAEQREQHALDLFRIAEEHVDLAAYSVVDIRLMQRVPEQEWRRWSAARRIDEWRSLVK
jgi:hypothetical protein